MSRPAWTLAEAAERCSVSRSTLKRRLSADELPNAYKTGNGQWRIPVTDLIALGYTPGKVDWGDTSQATTDGDQEPTRAPAPDRLRELEQELAQERLRRANAEQIAEERRARIEDLQMAMRLLESPRSAGGSQDSPNGSSPRPTDLGQVPPEMDHDPGRAESMQFRGGSREPEDWTTEPGQGGPLEPPVGPPPRQGWWARLTGR